MPGIVVAVVGAPVVVAVFAANANAMPIDTCAPGWGSMVIGNAAGSVMCLQWIPAPMALTYTGEAAWNANQSGVQAVFGIPSNG